MVVSGKLRGQRAKSMKFVSTLSGHTGCLVAASPELVVSCSYDRSDQLWDRRTGGSPSLQCQHGAPVEACLVTPSGGLLLTAGGTMVKVWDLVAGGRLLATLSPHQKTVKSLCLSGTGKYLGTGSLDRQAHWINLASFKTVYRT